MKRVQAYGYITPLDIRDSNRGLIDFLGQLLLTQARNQPSRPNFCADLTSKTVIHDPGSWGTEYPLTTKLNFIRFLFLKYYFKPGSAADERRNGPENSAGVDDMPTKSSLCIAMVAGSLGLGSTNARADWQYTKWGMTEPEVIKASNGAAGPASASDSKGIRIGTVTRLSAPYSAGPYQFRAIFAFDPTTNGLAVVRLVVVNKADGYGVKADLGAKYGPPSRTTTGIYATVEWQTDRDVVTFIDVAGGAFSVEYRPRETGASRGL